MVMAISIRYLLQATITGSHLAAPGPAPLRTRHLGPHLLRGLLLLGTSLLSL